MAEATKTKTNTWNLTWHYYDQCRLFYMLIYGSGDTKLNAWACFAICKDLVTNANHTLYC